MITPSSWPMTTFSSPDGVGEQVEGQPVLGVGRSLPTTGKPRVSSSTTRCRLACSAEPELRQPLEVVVGGPGPGQVAGEALAALERGQPGAAGEVEVAADPPDQARPRRRTVPVWSTGTIARSSRENPRAVPQETQTEFSK